MFDQHPSEVEMTSGEGEMRFWSVPVIDDPAEFEPYLRTFAEAQAWRTKTGGKLIVQFEEPDRLAVYGLLRGEDAIRHSFR